MHMTQSFSSGSTIFGDTMDDTHQFTGSLDITGSIITTGNVITTGSLNVSSSITANTFIGDGSNLTGIVSSSYAVSAS